MADYERNPDHGWARTGDFGTVTDDDIDRERERARRVTTHSRPGPKNYRRSDADILDDVCDSLTRHPDVDATDIDVHVEQGTVILSGVVPDRYHKRAAEDAAYVRGVTDVYNELRVSQPR
jgi:osmotically-inducible protein OsmY